MRLNRRNANYRHAFFLSPKYASFLAVLSMFYKLSGAFGRLIGDNVLLAVNHYHLEDNSCRKHFRFFCFGLPKCTIYKILYRNRAFLWVRIMNTNVRIMNISTFFDKFSPVYRLSSHFMVFYKKHEM